MSKFEKALLDDSKHLALCYLMNKWQIWQQWQYTKS